MPILGSSNHGILSTSNLWGSEIKKAPLFSDCFTDKVEDKHEVSFRASADYSGKLSLEVMDCSERSIQYLFVKQRGFRLNCQGQDTHKALYCRKAVILPSRSQNKDNEKPQQNQWVIKPLLSVSLTEKSSKQMGREIRAYLSNGDMNAVPSNLYSDTSKPPQTYSLDGLGQLTFSYRFIHNSEAPELLIIIRDDCSEGSKSISDKSWIKEANRFLGMVLDIIGFSQGAKVTVQAREEISKDTVKTVFPISDTSSPIRFMPTIQRQKDADTLIKHLVLFYNRQCDEQVTWETIGEAIDSALSVQRFNKMGLFSKLVAIEAVLKSYSEVREIIAKNGKNKKNKKGDLRKAINAFIDIGTTKDRRSLFPELANEEEREELITTRNGLAHTFSFEGDKESMVKLIAKTHDILTRLILSTLGFEGLFCRYDFTAPCQTCSKNDEARVTTEKNESCYGISEIKVSKLKDWQVSKIGDDRLDKFENQPGSRMSAINFRLNHINWRASATAFIREGEDDCCEND